MALREIETISANENSKTAQQGWVDTRSVIKNVNGGQKTGLIRGGPESSAKITTGGKGLRPEIQDERKDQGLKASEFVENRRIKKQATEEFESIENPRAE